MRLILAIFLIMTACGKKETAAEKPRFAVEATKPIVKDVQLYNTYVGNIQAYVHVDVKAQVEGVLLGADFKEGQVVNTGDLLFVIDSRPYEAQLEKAEAALAKSQANLNYAEEVVKRNKELAKEYFVSQLQYEQYLTNVLTFKAQVKENEADITTAKINISYCKIHSPITAVTGKLKLQVGNLIENAGSTPLITLNQIAPIYVYFSVPQKDLPLIMKLHRQSPMKLSAFLENDDMTPYDGTLDLIDNQLNDQTGTVWLRGVVPNSEQMLWPGEFVEVHLYTQSVENALLIPTEAVSVGHKGKYVFVVTKDQTAEIRYIETGQRLDHMTLVTKGLQPDDLVVTKGQINLGSGTYVSVKEGE